MNTDNTGHSRWSTASFGKEVLISSPDVISLGEHLCLCTTGNSRVVALQCAMERMNGYIQARLVTAMLIVLALVGISVLVI